MQSLGLEDQQESAVYQQVLHIRREGGLQCDSHEFHNPDTKGQTEQPGKGTWARELSVVE